MRRVKDDKSHKIGSKKLHSLTAKNNINQKVKGSLIKASNDRFVLSDGYCLALINEDGEIVEQGDNITQEVFDVVSVQLVKSFCNRFRGFTEADFKKTG